MGNTMINEIITFFVSIFVEHPPIIYGFNIFNFLNPQMTWDFNFFNVFNPMSGAWDYAYVYFCIGGYMYLHRDNVSGGNVEKMKDIAVIGIIVSCAIRFVLGLSYSKLIGERWDIVWNGYGSIFTLITVLCVYILFVNLKGDYRIIRLISQNTLGIYFIHEIIVALTINKLINVLEFKNIFANIIYALFLLFTSLCIALIIKKIPGIKKSLMA